MDMDIDQEQQLFEESRVIAIVGLSPNENRPSHRVGDYLKKYNKIIQGE